MDGQQLGQQQKGQPDQRTWYASLWKIMKKLYGKKVFCAVFLLINISINISINLYIISLVFISTLVKAIRLIGILVSFVYLLIYVIRIKS